MRKAFVLESRDDPIRDTKDTSHASREDGIMIPGH